MRILFLVLGILASASALTAQDAKVLDFRKAKWGMTRDQVKATESSSSKMDSEDGLGYVDRVGDYADTLIFYFFAEGKLVRANYSFGAVEKHTNQNLYLDDFDKIKASLVDKYGKPKADEHIWKDNLYRDDPDHWGMAVSAGHLIVQAGWITERTEILEQLKGDNFEISLRVQYKSRELAHLEEEKEKKKKNADF